MEEVLLLRGVNKFREESYLCLVLSPYFCPYRHELEIEGIL